MKVVGKTVGVGEPWRCREDEARIFGECKCEKGVGGAGKRRNSHRPAFRWGGGREARREQLERVFHLAAVDYTILKLIFGRWRVCGGASFGLGLASLAANTRQGSGKKAGGDIDFAAFYILPVPSRNRVASVFFTRPRVRFGLARALHEPPTSGGYVASHAAETPPPRPRHSLSINWESATLAPACAARPTASVDMPSWRRSEWLEWLGTARSRCKSHVCASWWCVDISGREGFARFWYNVLHGSSL